MPFFQISKSSYSHKTGRPYRIFLLGLTALLLLNGCASSTAIPSPTIAASQTPPSETATAFQQDTATQTSAPPSTATVAPPSYERVLIISIDGLRPEAIVLTSLPNLENFMETGTYTLTAETTLPSSTLPAHASMLTGMCPDKHGIDWNEDAEENGFANSPSIFEIAHNAGLKTVMIVGKKKLRQITLPENTDIYEFVGDNDSKVAEVAAQILAEGFDLAFVHFAKVDHLGHSHGWLSPTQLLGAQKADDAIGVLLNALEEANLREGTLIIATADHGGYKRDHGGSLPSERKIPWIVSGISQDSLVISRPISITDTAATAAYALGLPIPEIWDGIPALEAFGGIPPERTELPCE